jgi:hypothetical protein
MRRCLLNILLLSFLLMIPRPALFAQHSSIDSGYIRLFEKTNVIELYPGIYSTRFNFSNRGEPKSNYRLVANSSGFVGFYLGYKWFSLKYSWAIPGTQLAKNIKLQSTSLGFSFGMRKYSFRPFYNVYDGLLIPADLRSRDFRAFRDIKFTEAGLDMFYFFRTDRFSFRAANGFSEQQIKSKGSFFLKLTPMWQKVNWEDPSRDVITDSATYTLLAYDPEWFSMIARIGYGYNFSFKKGKWSIAPSVLIGGGALREINTGVDHLQLVTDIQASLRAGFNSPLYYVYGTVRWGDLKTNLFIKNLHQVNSNFSITGGYRFRSLKKKILRVL